MIYLLLGLVIFILIHIVLRSLTIRLERKDKAWSEYEELRIIEILQEGPDIKSFRLERASGVLFPPFKAGQFLTFKIDDGVTRTYSISSSILKRENVQIGIKKIEGGLASSWFHSRKLGDKVLALAPQGNFVLKGVRPVIFIAGGIGITPILSMIKSLVYGHYQKDSYLFYCAKSEEHLAFHQSLLGLTRYYERFKYVPVLSRGSDDWKGERGHISLEVVERFVDPRKAELYICGPDSMQEALISSLKEKNVEEIYFEKFTTATSSGNKVDVTVKLNNKKYQYSGKENLLEFFENMGENISYSCRAGVCGTCRLRLTKGEVHSEDMAALTKDEIDEGHILCCVSFPKTDVEIEYE